MRFLSAAHTDVGISKNINQDAFCLKVARVPKYNVAFAVLCDGMGGLKSGELASAFVINAFSNWFDNEFPSYFNQEFKFSAVKFKWNEMIAELNQKIMSYGSSKGISLGTTLTAVLIVNDEYVFAQVGDSRLYKIDTKISQLSKDHTLVAYEVEQQKITSAQAKSDNRKNILLQCIGATKNVVPDIVFGRLCENDVFLLCSDGFRHEVAEAEMFGILAPALLTSEKIMKKSLVDLVELNKSRKEQDNITAVIIKVIR